MTPLFILLAVIVGLVVIVALWVMGVYNGLIKLRNRYRNAFDVQVILTYWAARATVTPLCRYDGCGDHPAQTV